MRSLTLESATEESAGVHPGKSRRLHVKAFTGGLIVLVFILAGIFGRVMRQLLIGVAIGALLAMPIFASFDLSMAGSLRLLAIVSSIIVMVGIIAPVGPAGRSLRIPATEALRTDG